MLPNIQRDKLFLASRIALIATAMTFAFRAALEGVWGTEFTLTKEQVGWIFAPAFWGFTLAQIFGGTLVDVLGMKKLLGLAFLALGLMKMPSAPALYGRKLFLASIVYLSLLMLVMVVDKL